MNLLNILKHYSKGMVKHHIKCANTLTITHLGSSYTISWQQTRETRGWTKLGLSIVGFPPKYYKMSRLCWPVLSSFLIKNIMT